MASRPGEGESADTPVHLAAGSPTTTGIARSTLHGAAIRGSSPIRSVGEGCRWPPVQPLRARAARRSRTGWRSAQEYSFAVAARLPGPPPLRSTTPSGSARPQDTSRSAQARRVLRRRGDPGVPRPRAHDLRGRPHGDLGPRWIPPVVLAATAFKLVAARACASDRARAVARVRRGLRSACRHGVLLLGLGSRWVRVP